MLLNDANVCEAIKRYGPFDSLLDIGCWDGVKTQQYIKAASSTKNFGLEPVVEYAKKAQALSIDAKSALADVGEWPFDPSSINCIVSNQLIEHLSNPDIFIEQAYRVLKPGGYLITSTNNLSSWHNIIALVLGWTPFDLTNSSSRALGLGNPLSLHRGKATHVGGSTWTHKTIFTARWLNDWFSVYGFEPIETFGAGYHPLPASLGRYLKKHSAFITLVNRKPI